MCRSAIGATPRSLPSEAAPVPAMVEATWVPWPLPSSTDSPGTKSSVAVMRSARSGWVVSTPVSRTATSTPLPVFPDAHTCGAPICAVLSARAAFTLPSSQTLAIPALRAGRSPALRAVAPASAPPVIDDQKTAVRSAPRAAPWMLSRVRTLRAPLGTGRARERAAASV